MVKQEQKIESAEGSLNIINTESGSIHAATRRSRRLLGLSADENCTTCVKRKIKPVCYKGMCNANGSRITKKKKRSVYNKADGVTTVDGSYTSAQKAERYFRFLGLRLRRYKGCFRYGPDYEERTCILPSGDTFTWQEKSCGTTWIALYGNKPYIVVAMDPRSEHKKSPREYSPENRPPVNIAVHTILHQMGDTSSPFNQEVAHHTQGKPFVVVSAAPETFEDQKSRHEATARTIDFLSGKLKDRSCLTFDETTQMGVCALKIMFGSKFKSNQITRSHYDGVGWNGGSSELRTSRVDECLKVLSPRQPLFTTIERTTLWSI